MGKSKWVKSADSQHLANHYWYVLQNNGFRKATAEDRH